MASHLDQQQLAAVQSTHRKTVVVASPGAGKTRVLVERVAHLVGKSRVRAAQICVVTFTNAAAAEVQRRLREHPTLLPDETNIGYVGTLHTLMFRLICARPELVEHVGRIIVIDEEQADEILKEIIKSLRYRGTLRDVREAMKLGPGVLSQNRGHTPPTQPETVAMEYYRRMRSNGLMDFDSILWYGARLLERTKKAHDFSHLLVDEMQDSGDADVEIYRGMNCQTFCVGDPRQAIYSFRGGDLRHLTRMAMDEENNVLSLPNNYRCDAAICRVANALMRGKGHDETVSMTERDGVVTFHGYQTELSETGALTDALTKLDRPKDCAVLVRTNWLAERYAEALTNAGIPVAKKAQLTRPKDWRAARDIVMMLADPSNDHLTYRVLVRSRGREDADKMKLAAMQAFKSINSLWLNLPETMEVGLVGPALARAKIGPESIALIEQLIRDNTSLKTVAELTVALAQEDLTRQEEGEGVTVTTMHSAKGREWDHVFLPAFNDGVVPNARKDSDEEEERRLVFVAVTRARHTLSVTWAALRTERWKREPVGVEPSRFLEQMRG